MRCLSFQRADGSAALGVRIGEEVVDISALGFPDSLDALLVHGEAALQAAKAAAELASVRMPLAGVTHLPPLRNPSKAFAVGLNYVDHAKEGNFAPPRHPVLFQRYPSSWVGHGAALVKPRISDQFDYEAELVVVIGKAGLYIDRSRALEHVAGYSLFNDGSVRDYQMRSHQWLWGKNFDASGSFGPEFVTPDELPPGASSLRLQCRLNGRVVQDANTRDMIFDVQALVAACSEGITLQPGDIIITGTPSGVGFARNPPLWMQPGDVCEVEVEGLGVLRNPVRAE